jgi:DNA-binding CsgD family transcriptional regulator
MDPSRVPRLTDGQRACLRLVLEHKTSKEIARDLGISRFTVDKRLEAAMSLLGVGSRIEAARLLADDLPGYERFVCEPDRLGASPLPVIMAPSQSSEEAGEPRVRDSAVDAGPLGSGRPPSARRAWVRLPRSTGGRERYDLSTTERLIWIGAVALAAILLAFLAFAAAESLQRTLRAFVG